MASCCWAHTYVEQRAMHRFSRCHAALARAAGRAVGGAGGLSSGNTDGAGLTPSTMLAASSYLFG
eukprot:361277-Chlamydomonas_euryale.AAC.7